MSKNLEILMIGFGAVQTAISILWNKVIPHRKIKLAIIIEPRDLDYVPDFPHEHIKIGLKKTNYKKILDEIIRLHNIKLVIDLSIFVDSITMIDYFQDKKIMYLNTAIENWENYPQWDGSLDTIWKHSLLHQQKIIERKHKNSKVTHLLTMGENPGFVSLFVKIALDKIAKQFKIKSEYKFGSREYYSDIAQQLKLETIHISERDTQITKMRKPPNSFVNTWSCLGFYEESIDSVQIGWGTHEGKYPNQHKLIDHQILIPKHSMNVFAKSYEPKEGIIKGRVISHNENSTITKYLSTIGSRSSSSTQILNSKQNLNIYRSSLKSSTQILNSKQNLSIYRPSTYYVYSSCPISQKSLQEIKEHKYNIQDRCHVLKSKEIKSGYDSVGVLLLFGDDKPGFWCGTILTNNEAKKISSYVNATTVQVTTGIFSGIEWMMRHQTKGIVFPEELDPYDALDLTKDWMGTFFCNFVDFKPKSNKFIDLMV